MRRERPDDRQWDHLLAELEALVSDLRSHSKAVRSRSKDQVIDGYPTKSMPESSIASGRHADPTATTVERLAGGEFRETDEGIVITPDHWQGPPDPVGVRVNRMHSEALDARNRLRGAVAAMRDALPPHQAVHVREQCVHCGILRSIAGEKNWSQGEASCQGCLRRKRRHSEPAEVAQ